MPGLLGIVSNNIDDEQLLNRMIDSVKHKDWQCIDKYVESPFSITRVHLGIFNPEPQPIFSEDRTLCIFMYGKIYGYEEQMKDLKGKHKFTFDNDPEFCLHSYEEYGKEFAKKLNGSFILIICDFKKRELLIINDRYGLIPLNYMVDKNKLLFASEINAILQDRTFGKELNEETVADFFAFGEVFGNKTFFKGIEVLPPASIFTYDGQFISVERYWDFNYEPDYKISENEIVDLLVKTLKDAVEIRIKDNLRYGILLSGGLDSRTVIGAIDKEKRGDLITITFGVPRCDDARIAEVVSRVAGTKHIFVEIDPNKVLTPYPEQIVCFTDGMHPIHGSFVPPVYEKTRSFVDVLCEGLATDLLLGGSFLKHKIFKAKNDTELIEMGYKRRIFSDDAMAKLLTANYYDKIKDMPLQSIKKSFPKTKGHPCNKWDYVMLQNHVRRLTFMGYNPITQNFMETMTPTYDNDFIDVILQIPPELRFRHYIYRKFIKKLAPELFRIPYNYTMVAADAPLMLWSIGKKYQHGKAKIKRLLEKMSKGKIYFENRRPYLPISIWLRRNQNWKDFAKNTLLSKDAYLRNILRQEFIRTIIEEHESYKIDHFLRINYLITFELFLQKFF